MEIKKLRNTYKIDFSSFFISTEKSFLICNIKYNLPYVVCYTMLVDFSSKIPP